MRYFPRFPSHYHPANHHARIVISIHIGQLIAETQGMATLLFAAMIGISAGWIEGRQVGQDFRVAESTSIERVDVRIIRVILLGP